MRTHALFALSMVMALVLSCRREGDTIAIDAWNWTKGGELHIWETRGQIYFNLMVATNGEKTIEDIAGGGYSLSDVRKIDVVGGRKRLPCIVYAYGPVNDREVQAVIRVIDGLELISTIRIVTPIVPAHVESAHPQPGSSPNP